MGVFDKLAFWKKKDDFSKEFGADFGNKMAPDFGMGNIPGQDFGNYPHDMQRTGVDQNMNLGIPDDTGFGTYGPPGQQASMQQPFGAPLQPQQPDFKSDKFEVVSAKLDSIRYTLESINQRLANLERIAYGEEKKRGW